MNNEYRAAKANIEHFGALFWLWVCSQDEFQRMANPNDRQQASLLAAMKEHVDKVRGSQTARHLFKCFMPPSPDLRLRLSICDDLLPYCKARQHARE